MGIVPANSAARSRKENHHHDDGMEYIGQDRNHFYYKFEQNGDEKLNAVKRDTGEVYVSDYSGDRLNIEGKELVYDPSVKEREINTTTSSVSIQSSGTPNVIERVGDKRVYLDSCTFDCLTHSYHVACVELNKYAATVSKAVLVSQVIKAMAKKVPGAFAKILKRESVADALGSVISAAAGNVVSIGSVEWDQNVPLVRDQKMRKFKGGMTSWKPPRDESAFTTFFALPDHGVCPD